VTSPLVWGSNPSDPTTNARDPIASLLAFSEEIGIVEITKTSVTGKRGFAGDISIADEC
jgi:hypothetical protein